jgi:hypothetical protein
MAYLEKGAGQLLQGLRERRLIFNGVVKAHNRKVLLAGVLLRFDQARSAIHAHNQAARHLR